MLLQLATLKFVARQVACGVVIRATKVCYLQSNNAARQVARKCCPYYLACTAHDFNFASLACANERVHMHNVRDFPQGKLGSEINARFLLSEPGDLYFYFIISMRTVSSITEKKISRNLWLLFWANEINSAEGGIMGPTAHVQIMFPLKDKKNQGISRHFLWDVDE